MKQKTQKNNSPHQNLCEINWYSDVPSNWPQRFELIEKSSILQSLPYLHASSKLNNNYIRYGLIIINDQEAGLCAILEAGALKNAIHAVILDQGPLWFEGFGTEYDFALFLKSFRQDFPRRFGRRVRFIPHIKNSKNVRKILKENGFRPTGKPYQTTYINISESEENLRKALHKNWRGSLKKAQKSNIKLQWEEGGAHLAWLVENHLSDRIKKNYNGMSLKMMMAMISQFSRGQNLMIGTAILDDQPIASILIFIHGKTATYQIGYTSDLGRKNCAGHLLLWEAIKQLKERDINDFDLGGINDEDAKGVRDFKIGMGGESFETPGLWI